MIIGLGARHWGPQWRALRALRRSIHWPACPNPSPYQIFGLDAGTPVVDKKRLRQVYYELVKIYHPDRGTTGDADRFKRIVEAHDILKDESRRRSYDASTRVYGTGASGVRYQRTYESHFDDDSDVNYWSHANNQKFDKGLYESRIWVLKCVVVVTVIIAAANLFLLKRAAGTRAELLDAETEKAAAQLARAAASRYPEDTPQDVIDRFLENRQRTLDRYGQQLNYKRFVDGPGPDAAPGRRASEPSRRETPPRDAPLRAPRSKYSEAPNPNPKAPTPEPEQDARPRRRANGEHEGPVAAYFGR